MSYDFKLFRPRENENPEQTALRDMEEVPYLPPDPQKEALKRRVAKALVEYDKRLEVFQFDYEKIAHIRKISIEQARLQFRHLELSDETTGIQITLFDDEASVTVPYWHVGEKADTIFRHVFECVRIISQESGFVAFDPQVGRVLDPTADLDEIISLYVGQVRGLRNAHSAAKKIARPWWKLW